MSNPNGEQVIPEHLPPPVPIEATEPNPIQKHAAPEPEPKTNPAETSYIDYGIRLPNGEVHYGNFGGRPIDTPEARAIFLSVLRATARDTGFEEAEFLSRYSWVGRHVHLTALGDVAITSEIAAPPLQLEPGQ